MKYLLILVILFFSGCSNEIIVDNNTENNNKGNDVLPVIEKEYEKLQISDLNVNVDLKSLPSYSITISSKDKEKITGNVMISLNCNYTYTIGTLPNLYNATTFDSKLLYFNNENETTISGYLSINPNYYSFSNCNWNILSVNGIIEV